MNNNFQKYKNHAIWFGVAIAFAFDSAIAAIANLVTQNMGGFIFNMLFFAGFVILAKVNHSSMNEKLNEFVVSEKDTTTQ